MAERESLIQVLAGIGVVLYALKLKIPIVWKTDEEESGSPSNS